MNAHLMNFTTGTKNIHCGGSSHRRGNPIIQSLPMTPMGMPDNTPGQEQSSPPEDCVAFQALYSHPCQLSQQLQGRDQGVLLLEIQDTMSLFRFWPDAKALGYQFNW